MNVDQTMDFEIEYEGETLDIREIPVMGTVDTSRGYGYMGEGGTIDIDLTVELSIKDVQEIFHLHFEEQNLPVPAWVFEESAARTVLEEVRDKAEQYFNGG